VVSALLLGGQLGQLAPLLAQAGGLDWLRLLRTALGLMVEPALPIVCLFACGAAYSRLRADGAWHAALALGHHPARLFAPALGVGLGAALLASFLAHGPAPQWVAQTRQTVERGLAVLPRGVALPLVDGHARLDDAGVLHAVVNHTFIRAEAPRMRPGWRIEAGAAWIWGPKVRVRTDAVVLQLRPPRVARRLGVLGPPNSVPTAALDDTPRHRFLAQRRTALPALSVIWALLGALLGARWGGLRMVAGGTAAVGIGYWVLRTGELTARAGFMSPTVAAWAPFALMVAVCAGISVARR
jgi:lipopolysaccharide export LptBFGC system permease protein LptF